MAARASLLVPAAIVALAMLPAVGCGKKGPPQPPEPRGPLAPEDLRVRQSGDRVLISLRVPAPRGEKFAQQPVRVEMMRVTYAPGVDTPADPDAFRRRGELVGSLEADPLPSGSRVQIVDAALGSVTDGFPAGWSLRYGVRVRDRKGRSSPLMVSPDLVPVSPLPAPVSVTAVATAEGVRLKWDAGPADASDGETKPRYNVYRTTVGKPFGENPVNAGVIDVAEYLDARVETGEEYAYVVRRAASSDPPYLESASSAAVEIRAIDLFAPEAPSGLIVVQEGVGVRLFWYPNRERDLAGYRVYRRVGDGEWERQEPAPVTQPLYLDRDVEVGQRVEYRITAVDRAEPPNESGPSETAGLVVAEDPDQWEDGGR